MPKVITSYRQRIVFTRERRYYSREGLSTLFHMSSSREIAIGYYRKGGSDQYQECRVNVVSSSGSSSLQVSYVDGNKSVYVTLPVVSRCKFGAQFTIRPQEEEVTLVPINFEDGDKLSIYAMSKKVVQKEIDNIYSQWKFKAPALQLQEYLNETRAVVTENADRIDRLYDHQLNQSPLSEPRGNRLRRTTLTDVQVLHEDDEPQRTNARSRQPSNTLQRRIPSKRRISAISAEADLSNEESIGPTTRFRNINRRLFKTNDSVLHVPKARTTKANTK